MYSLFKYKGMKPSEVYWLPFGEKKILSAFMSLFVDEKIKENKGNGGGK